MGFIRTFKQSFCLGQRTFKKVLGFGGLGFSGLGVRAEGLGALGLGFRV